MKLYNFIYGIIEIQTRLLGEGIAEGISKEVSKSSSLLKYSYYHGIKLLFKLLWYSQVFPGRINVFWFPCKFVDLIEGEKTFFNIYIGAPGKHMLKNRKKLWGCGIIEEIYDIDRYLNIGYVTKNYVWTQKAVKKLCEVLNKKKINLIVLGNDATFFERTCIVAGRRLGIPVVSLQHGIYAGTAEEFREREEGKYSDYHWVWGETTRQKFLEAFGFAENRVKVIGYPFKMSDFVLNHINRSKKRVMFIGVYYSLYNTEDGKKFENLAKMVCDICRECGYEFVYRCHPNEDLEQVTIVYRGYAGFNISTEKSLYKDLASVDLLIGDVSSVMVEGALIGKSTVQVLRNDYIEKIANDNIFSFAYKVKFDRTEIKNAIVNNLEHPTKPVIDRNELYINPNIINDVKNEIINIVKNSRNNNDNQKNY